MADSVELLIDPAEIARAGDKLVRSYLAAGTRAVGTTTRNLEQRLEQATQAAVPGRLWRAWQSSTFPKSGPARDPVGTVWLKGGARTRGAIEFWTQPGAIRGRGGQYLAIPLPAAGSQGRSRNLTPGEWERRTGIRLRFVYRQGKPSLLVAPGGTTGRGGVFRELTKGKRGRIAQGRSGANPLVDAIIPIFVLLPMVKFGNAFAIEPMIEASYGELAREFFQAIKALG